MSVASEAVAAYRREPMLIGMFPDENEVLDRLEADPRLPDRKPSGRDAGIVSAALTQLAARPTDLIFWTLQAAALAVGANEASSEYRCRAKAFSEASQAAQRLAEFCHERVPLDLYARLPALIAFLDRQAAWAMQAPVRLQIKRPGASPLLAVRHLGLCLRDHRVRVRHQAIAWLVETALAIPPLTPNAITHALRHQM